MTGVLLLGIFNSNFCEQKQLGAGIMPYIVIALLVGLFNRKLLQAKVRVVRINLTGFKFKGDTLVEIIHSKFHKK